MNPVQWLTFLVLVAVAFGYPEQKPRECIYIHGICQRECEEGTYAYESNCDYLVPEATCDDPDPQQDPSGQVCDFSACYCADPTVRDPVTNKCIAYEDCYKN